jgi:hypothetical protein
VSDRNHFPVFPVLFALAVLLVLANNAHAYIGPGAGLEQVTYAMSLFAAVGVAFSAVLLWPFYALLRLLRRKSAPPAVADPAPTAAPGAGVGGWSEPRPQHEAGGAESAAVQPGGGLAHS